MSKRIQKVNGLIKEELGKIILKEVDLPKDVLATVTRVITSPNLSQSKVYISVIPVNQAAKVLQILQGQIYFLQQKLNRRLNMSPIPKINFIEEKETKKAGKIEKILASLKKEEK